MDGWARPLIGTIGPSRAGGHDARAKLADVEARITAALDELGLTMLVTSIDGLPPVGAAAILAQTGDLRRFTCARAVVKHAGLAPRNASPAPSPGEPA